MGDYLVFMMIRRGDPLCENDSRLSPTLVSTSSTGVVDRFSRCGAVKRQSFTCSKWGWRQSGEEPDPRH
jgi:hypothetical protein